MKIYFLITGITAAVLSLVGGVVLALPVLVAALLGLYPLHRFLARRAYLQELKRYAEQIDNIYIYSEHEGDGTVRLRAEYAEKMLREAKNQQKVMVYRIYFGAGEHVNETWEEFEERLEAFIKEDKKKRHIELEKSGALYENYWLKQKFADNAARDEPLPF